MAGTFYQYWTFENKLRNKQISPLTSFFGDEGYLRKRAIDLLRRDLLQESDQSYNYDVSYADEVNLSEFLNQARTLPMLSPLRLMVLKNTDKIPQANAPLLEEYLTHPSSKTFVVFDYSPLFSLWKKENKRNNIYLLMDRYTVKYEFRRFKEGDLIQFLKNYVADEGFEVDPASLKFISQRLGGDLELIVHELEKLFLLSDDSETIQRKDMENLVGKHPFATIFDMLNAVARRNTSQALVSLDVLLVHGEPHLIIIRMLTRFIQQLMVYKTLFEMGKSNTDIMRELNLKTEYQLKDLRLGHHNFSRESLWRCLALMGQTDEDFKRKHVDIRTHLELLLIQICRMGRASDEPRGN